MNTFNEITYVETMKGIEEALRVRNAIDILKIQYDNRFITRERYEDLLEEYFKINNKEY